SLQDAVEGNVVIARNDDARYGGQLGKKVRGLFELNRLRPLSEVSTDDDQVGSERMGAGKRRLSGRRHIGRPEVKIAEMKNPRHFFTRAPMSQPRTHNRIAAMDRVAAQVTMDRNGVFRNRRESEAVDRYPWTMKKFLPVQQLA